MITKRYNRASVHDAYGGKFNARADELLDLMLTVQMPEVELDKIDIAKTITNMQLTLDGLVQ